MARSLKWILKKYGIKIVLTYLHKSPKLIAAQPNRTPTVRMNYTKLLQSNSKANSFSPLPSNHTVTKKHRVQIVRKENVECKWESREIYSWSRGYQIIVLNQKSENKSNFEFQNAPKIVVRTEGWDYRNSLFEKR